jgi:hypothetical protein
MRKITRKWLIQGVLGFSGISMLMPIAALAAVPPTQVGQCSDTFIQRVGTRLMDGQTGAAIPGSGTAVKLTNGIYLVSYEDVPQLSRDSRVEDKVKLCLLSIPENCPPDDDRGRFYSLLNYRTEGYVELPDSQHMCGGA